MFSKKSGHSVWDKFLVLGVFVAFVGAGFIYIGVLLWGAARGSAAVPVIAVASGPSSEEYQASCRDIAGPFLRQAEAVDPAQIGSVGPELAKLAEATRQRLMRLRVPAPDRDAHLRLILLLDEWKKAAAGSADDAASAAAHTADLLAAFPWLMR